MYLGTAVEPGSDPSGPWSARALPVNLDLKISDEGNTGREPTRFDIFEMCDCIIYIDLAGKVTTRI